MMKHILALLIFIAPSSLFAVDVELKFKDNSDNEESFILEQRVGPSGEFAEVQTNEAEDNSFIVEGVPLGVEISWRVKARNRFGDSGYTNEFSLSTLPPQGPISATGERSHRGHKRQNRNSKPYTR